MDSSRFAKMVRECGLLKKKKETPAGIVDLIYAKAKPLNGRRLEFKHFLEVRSSRTDRPEVLSEAALSVSKGRGRALWARSWLCHLTSRLCLFSGAAGSSPLGTGAEN